MAWTARQIAMLAEIGVHVPATSLRAAPVVATETTQSPTATAVIDVSPPPPAPIAAIASPAPTARRIDAAPVVERAESVRPLNAQFAHLGWSELRDTVAACTACGLCKGRTQTVFGVGSQQAHWMVVGEAPGEQEDLRGEPFVGKSGQLLDNMLASIGLGRAEAVEGQETPSPASRVYIANTVKCRPPGNRNPTPEELATCEPYLIRQVELVKPKIILAMGRFAVQRLLQTDEPIGRLRGRVHRYQDVPLIVTYHPAYLLRNLVDKARAWDDLCLALETYSGVTSS